MYPGTESPDKGRAKKLAKSHSLLVPLFHQKVVIGQGPIAKGGPKEFKQMFYRGRNLLYIYGIGWFQ